MDSRETLCENPVIITDRDAWKEINLKDAGTIEVEIGFGSGEYLLRRASEYPERLFIGIEKKPGMITEVSKRVASHNLNNIRLLESCAKDAFADLFPANSISRVYSLFPDPWPKRKHLHYRLFSSEYLRLLNNRLIFGSEALIVTDSEDYCNWMLKQLPDTGFEVENSIIPPQFDTRFERKWLEQNFNTFFRILLKKARHIET
ncbi:tRNA (guanine(46)-N(7))-methyltransferase TrmB [Chlorobium phaeobacteroides]|nr:tRNA (guanine-N7)-methyltransferase [Chlorobium phaeobacteroides]